jgi:DNA-binding SARP family transcriptional activator
MDQRPPNEIARRTVLEQHTQAAAIRRLVVTVDEQRRRLDTQMSEALDMLAVAANRNFLEEVPGAGPSDNLTARPRTVVRCLGSLTVQIGDTRVGRWRSGKAKALFEYLVTHRGRVIPRDVLIEVLWPDPEAAASSISLKVAIHALRQVLAEFNEPASAGLSIEAHESGYEMIGPDVWLDVEEFERCCSLAARLEASNRPEEALSFYEYAGELYAGDFLAESVDDWAVFRRESLKDQFMFALARLADAAIVAGDLRGCISRCRQLLDLDRYREDTFRTLMICHARLGQPGRVRRWYELCVQTLHDELEMTPSAETVRVFEHALRRD